MRSTTMCGSISAPTQWQRTACATVRGSSCGRTSPVSKQQHRHGRERLHVHQHDLRTARVHLFGGRPVGHGPPGQTDGIIGIFDNGVTTNQFTVNNFNGGDTQNLPGGGVPFWFASLAGDGVWQHQGRVSLTAVRRLRFRLPVGAERLSNGSVTATA